MSFSKTEREFLEHIKNNKKGFKKNIYVNKEEIDLDTTDMEIWRKSTEKFEKERREISRRENNYNQQLSSRINRKVKQMEADIKLYYEVRKKGDALWELLRYSVYI